MKVNILYFAKLREAVGVEAETLEINENSKVSDLLNFLKIEKKNGQNISTIKKIY